MKKRILTALLASAMILSVAGCDSTTDAGADTTTTTAAANDGADVADTDADTDTDADAGDAGDAAAEEGKVLNIYCWNTEFQGLYEKYAADIGEDAGVTVNWVINANEGSNYQDKLDLALSNQATAAADEKVDMFLIEADYALKYTNSDYSMNVMDLGITEADIANQYAYTQQVATANGALKGLTWQATPGLFAYRRSIAKEVLGTDDPTEVQAMLSDWTKFDEVAAKMQAAGYTMLAGYDDAYRTFSNNVSAPWVVNGELKVDDNLWTWVDQTKTYTDSGYHAGASLWDATWNKEQGPDGKTFGFFYSTWGINFTLLGNSLATPESEGGVAEVGNGIYGDYAVCEGPQAYYWGGTWLCAAAGTDNPTVIAEIMKRMTCDTTTMKQITLDTQDYTNNSVAMNEIANDASYGSAFLGGQNHVALFAAAAPNIDTSNMSEYDQLCNEKFQSCMKDYFTGNATKEEALANFYATIGDSFPELTIPQA